MKKIKKFFLILFIAAFAVMNCYGQNQGINNNWLMGYQSLAGPPGGQTLINFFNGAPLITYDSLEMDFRHTHANIADSNGNMLFYTNGYYIADATNDTMQNGSGINPGAYANFAPEGFLIPQGALAIQKPNSNNLFYLFHSSCDQYPMNGCSSYRLYVTEIDINLNGGFGAVIIKNLPVISDTLNTGKITACKHANGRDWWVVVHKVNSNKFYKLLVTPSGILGPYSQNIGSYRDWDAGQAKFSPDGKRYAYFHYRFTGLDVFDFDRCTGVFSNWRNDSVPLVVGNVGCAFSSNSDVLYVGNILKTYQYIASDINLQTNRTEVAVYDSFVDPQNFLETYLCYPELAPDGKIYITTGNSTQFMHVINSPDSLGLTCDVVQHGVFLPSLYFNTLPNHPNYFLGCDTTSTCICLTTNLYNQEQKNISAHAAPNPTTGIFTLQFPVQKTSGALEIFDVMGNSVLKEYVSAWSQYKKVSIGQLASGIYLCRITWGNGVSGSVKVIKE